MAKKPVGLALALVPLAAVAFAQLEFAADPVHRVARTALGPILMPTACIDVGRAFAIEPGSYESHALVFEGRVVDAAGAPAGGVVVELHGWRPGPPVPRLVPVLPGEIVRRPPPEVLAIATTDAAGRFRVAVQAAAPPNDASLALRMARGEREVAWRTVEAISLALGDTTLGAGGRLRGTVRAGARVEVATMPAIAALADAGGRFDLGIVPIGRVGVVATSADCVPAPPIEVDVGEAGATADFALVPLVEQKGRIVDGAGRPLPGASIEAPLRFHCVNCDDDGRFVLGPMAPGSCDLVASAPGMPSRVVHADVPSEPIEIALEPEVMLEGCAVDAAGDPVALAWIGLEKLPRLDAGTDLVVRGDRMPWRKRVRAAADAVAIEAAIGAPTDSVRAHAVPIGFAFDAPGDFRVYARRDAVAKAPGFVLCAETEDGRFATAAISGLDRDPRRVELVLRFGRQPPLDIELVAPGGESMAGVVRLLHDDSVGDARATDASGVARFFGLAPGRTRLVATQQTLAASTCTETWIDVPAEGGRIRVTMEPALTLSGVARFADGTPIPRATIVHHPPDRAARIEEYERAGDDGAFRIDGLTPGPRVFELSMSGDASLPFCGEWSRELADPGIEVTLPQDGPLDLRGPWPAPGGLVAPVLVNGHAPADGTWHLVRVAPISRYSRHAITGIGRIDAIEAPRLPPGPYRLFVRLASGSTVLSDEFAIDPGVVRRTPFEFTVIPELKGRIVAPDGAPIAGAEVELKWREDLRDGGLFASNLEHVRPAPGGGALQVLSGDDGGFMLPDAQPGMHDVFVHLPGTASVARVALTSADFVEVRMDGSGAR